MYEGGTYTPARGLARRLLGPLRGLAERDRMRFVRGLAPGSRVLEVGAGDGKLVAMMREAGLDAHGIDPSPAACAAARAIGVEVANVGVGEAELEPASEDAVVLWHALEHLDDPAAALERIRSWLRPGRHAGGRRPQPRLGPGPDRRRSVVSSGRAPPPHPPDRRGRLGAARAHRHTGPSRVRHLLIEQNPLGMWQTLLNRLTVERDFAFRLLKRDLGEARAGRPGLLDLAVTAVAGPLLAPVAVLAELAAGLARRGGSIVVEARVARELRGRGDRGRADARRGAARAHAALGCRRRGTGDRRRQRVRRRSGADLRRDRRGRGGAPARERRLHPGGEHRREARRRRPARAAQRRLRLRSRVRRADHGADRPRGRNRDGGRGDARLAATRR